MTQNWPTKKQDIYDAQVILAMFGAQDKLLSIFEIDTDLMGNIKKVSLSEWVITLTKHYRSRYGEDDGDNIMKKVISHNMIQGETIH